MKTILHILYRFDTGGLEKILIDIVNALSADYKHVIVSLTDSSEQSESMLTGDIDIYQLNKREGADLGIWFKMHRLIRKIKPDVLQTYNLPTIEYQLIGAITRVPLRVHAEHGRHSYDPEGRNVKYALLRKCLKPLIHNWIAVSRDLHDWLLNSIGIAGKKIKLIQNGIDTEHFKPARHATAESRSNRLEGFAGEHSFVVGTIGRLDPVKNHKLLLEAIELIRSRYGQEYSNIVLAIVGSGALEKELSGLIREKSLNDCVWLPGARFNVAEQLRDFDLFVLSSIAEGIPVTLLEAMSTQIPVVSTSVGGIPEVVEQDCGLLVPPDNVEALIEAIITQYDNRDQGQRFGVRGRERVQQSFSQERMVSMYHSVYQG